MLCVLNNAHQMATEWQSLLDAYPPSPAEFLDPPPTLRDDCLTLLCRLFELAVNSRGSNLPPALLSQLHCEGFGSDEVWEELQLLNEPIVRYLQRYVGALLKKGSFGLLRKEEETQSTLNCGGQGRATTKDGSRVTSEEEDEEREVEEEDMDELENEDMLHEEDEEEEEEEEEEGERDRFFNLSEMEEFVNQSEEDMGKSCVCVFAYMYRCPDRLLCR